MRTFALPLTLLLTLASGCAPQAEEDEVIDLVADDKGDFSARLTLTQTKRSITVRIHKSDPYAGYVVRFQVSEADKALLAQQPRTPFSSANQDGDDPIVSQIVAVYEGLPPPYASVTPAIYWNFTASGRSFFRDAYSTTGITGRAREDLQLTIGEDLDPAVFPRFAFGMTAKPHAPPDGLGGGKLP
jgi:hypothetical protein